MFSSKTKVLEFEILLHFRMCY